LRKSLFIITIMCAIIGAYSFISSDKKPDADEVPQYIPPSPQRTGDAAKGYEYLTTGDYVKSGLPYSIFVKAIGRDNTNYLKREGLNATISHEYTMVKAPNGEDLVAPNCMQCHSQVFDGQLYVGMGNTFTDFSDAKIASPGKIKLLESMLKLTAPKKYQASKEFLDITKTIGPYLITKVRGVNAADRLAAVLAAHRNSSDFTWSSKPLVDIPEEVIPSDVPAWWLLKKKHAMFYNGFGRGDFGRFLMASNLLTVSDTAESRNVDNRISDVLAYIYSLQPPKYPKTINTDLAQKGKIIFTSTCSKCHGSYGENETYPNLLIPESIIQTDSFLYSANYQNPQFIGWFNNSWFAQGDHPAKLVPYNGYIAPPLDGVWATAPYLHNGSVPNLEALLNSKLRPMYWQRNFDAPKYDYENPGWPYIQHSEPGDNTVYNTVLNGYGNKGHYFGDKLTDKERMAVIEYLKTL
jgi:mono/diheme cytochrome c family protein